MAEQLIQLERVRLSGGTFDKRQDTIRKCAVGEWVELLPPEDIGEGGSIRVSRQNGEDLGYFPKEAARKYLEYAGQMALIKGSNVVRTAYS